MLAIRALHPGADEVGKALSPLGMIGVPITGLRLWQWSEVRSRLQGPPQRARKAIRRTDCLLPFLGPRRSECAPCSHRPRHTGSCQRDCQATTAYSHTPSNSGLIGVPILGRVKPGNVFVRKAAIAKLFLQLVRVVRFLGLGQACTGRTRASGFLIESAKLASGAIFKAFCISPVSRARHIGKPLAAHGEKSRGQEGVKISTSASRKSTKASGSSPSCTTILATST